MTHLFIDIETYSSVDLASAGVYKYTEAIDFEILLFAYAIDANPVIHILDVANGQFESRLLNYLTSPNVIKHAHNAAFERTCIAKHFNLKLDPSQWQCTMVKSAMAGYPFSLDQIATTMKLSEKKDAEGKKLIRFFSIPCKPSKSNGHRNRNFSVHDPAKWTSFKTYCAQDVSVEKAIYEKLRGFEINSTERTLWELDQRINDRGIKIDLELVGNALTIDAVYREKLTSEAIKLTGLNNPNSAIQLKKWLSKAVGEEVESLTKESVPALIKNCLDGSAEKRVLEIRQELSKTSVAKYQAMLDALAEDGRLHGLFQYYGASRTGRWAGRLVQFHNQPRINLKTSDLDIARKTVLAGDLDMLELCYGNVPDVLSQLIRTAFVPRENCRFIVSDFSAIEARVIAWLAGEKWRLDLFSGGKSDIYIASAAQMFKVPIENITKDSPLRQRGKVAELALGYQGAANALERMGALKMGLTEEELPPLVTAWRAANKSIVQYWATVQAAAFEALRSGKAVITHGIEFHFNKGTTQIKLPSGRCLCYINTRIEKEPRHGRDVIVYDGMNQTTKRWEKNYTYGGKLVENIVQAVARDLLAEKMMHVTSVGYDLVGHVHDELITETPIGKGSAEEVNKIMSTAEKWYKDLPLAAETFEANYYRK